MVIVFQYRKNQRTSQSVTTTARRILLLPKRKAKQTPSTEKKCQLCKESWNQTLRVRSKL